MLSAARAKTILSWVRSSTAGRGPSRAAKRRKIAHGLTKTRQAPTAGGAAVYCPHFADPVGCLLDSVAGGGVGCGLGG
jgi:hypothetical protein